VCVGGGGGGAGQRPSPVSYAYGWAPGHPPAKSGPDLKMRYVNFAVFVVSVIEIVMK